MSTVSQPTRERSIARELLSEAIHPRLAVFDESITQERRSALASRIAEYSLVAAVVLVIAGIEITRYLFHSPPQPLLFGIAAAVIIGYASVRIGFILKQLGTLRREQEARASLRSSIEDLCGRGYLLFDGITDPRGHLLGSVILGPSGVFTVVPRFLPRGDDLGEKIDVLDDQRVEIEGNRILADPLGQARRAASALYTYLAEHELTAITVHPVVVFPGWKVRVHQQSDVITVDERELTHRILQMPTVLEAKDLIGASLVLEKLHRNI